MGGRRQQIEVNFLLAQVWMGQTTMVEGDQEPSEEGGGKEGLCTCSVVRDGWV